MNEIMTMSLPRTLIELRINSYWKLLQGSISKNTARYMSTYKAV